MAAATAHHADTQSAIGHAFALPAAHSSLRHWRRLSMTSGRSSTSARHQAGERLRRRRRPGCGRDGRPRSTVSRIASSIGMCTVPALLFTQP